MRRRQVDGALRERYREFLELCKDLLTVNGYEVIGEGKENKDSLLSAPDLLVEKKSSGERKIVEVKLYRGRGIDRVLLENAVSSIDKYRDEYGLKKAILMLSLPVDEKFKIDLYNKRNIAVWDLAEIARRSAKDAPLAGRIEDFLRSAEFGALGVRPLSPAVEPLVSTVPREDSPMRGAELIRSLELCPSGRDSAAAFERLCEQSLKYLWGSEFRDWRPQNNVEGGFHRIDLIARLVPRHDFWMSVAQDFRARYLVFEFKNYSEEISQNQIYTTEKYLFPAALRPVAMIVARHGADKGAEHAIKGALRESGKLIICLDLQDVQSMLEAKDAGDDPNNLLIERVNELLMELGR